MNIDFYKIGVIGCGNMGAAIVRGLISSKTDNSITVLITDTDPQKTSALSVETGATTVELKELFQSADVVIIAVKPQDSKPLFDHIKEFIGENTVIVSVMAGVSISSIVKSIGRDIPVVRAMPNLPAVIGSGVTCFAYNSAFADRELIFFIFKGIGKVLEVREDDMDAITAISGSGPAYLFYFVDALVKSAISNGLSRDIAEEIVMQTFFGTAELLRGSDLDPEELIIRVASKGGTTEAALNVFNEKNMGGIISLAVGKARQRSKELSEG